MQLLRSGRSQEALDAFLKVVAKRGGDAPESHLECGILYLQHIKDPVAAIYHFNKYLALRPNSPQAEHTRELIETAKKEFARTLPAEPFEGQWSASIYAQRWNGSRRRTTSSRSRLRSCAGFRCLRCRVPPRLQMLRLGAQRRSRRCSRKSWPKMPCLSRTPKRRR
jgi:hypothetical protein